jgi:hypothetical protein
MPEGPYMQQLRALLGTKKKNTKITYCEDFPNIPTRYCNCSTKCKNNRIERIRRFCAQKQLQLNKVTPPVDSEFIKNLQTELEQEINLYWNSLQPQYLQPQPPQPLQLQSQLLPYPQQPASVLLQKAPFVPLR